MYFPICARKIHIVNPHIWHKDMKLAFYMRIWTVINENSICQQFILWPVKTDHSWIIIKMYKKCMLICMGKHLLQVLSSEPSEQSRFWSHIHANGIHSPVAFLHVNSSGEQTLASIYGKKFYSWKFEINFSAKLNNLLGK